jgi:hypothetical protein
MDLEQKKKVFDIEFRELIKLSKEIINNKYGVTIELGTNCPELTCIDNYMIAYNKMDAGEHYRYFESLYGRNRKAILTCLEDDHNWAQYGKIVVQFGEGLKVTDERALERRKMMKIDISAIYLMACDLKSHDDKNLAGIDEKFTDETVDKHRPELLLLHVIRIFYFLNDGVDKPLLLAIVNKIEEKIFGKKKTEIPVVETNNNNNNATGGIAGLFSIATGMMEKMGIKPPQNMKPPTEQEMGQVINNVFNNPNTVNAIQGLVSSLNGVQNIGDAVQTVVTTLTNNSSNMEALQNTIAQSAQAAHDAHVNNNTNVSETTTSTTENL